MDESPHIDGDEASGIQNALLDPSTRAEIKRLLDRIERNEESIEDLHDAAAVAETEREQNRELADDARDVAGKNTAALNRLKTQIHFGKERRKKILLNAADARADEDDEGRGRMLVKEGVDELRKHKHLSRQTIRQYFSEIAAEYDGIYYRQAREPKYRGRNVKALYFYADDFWSSHDADELLF